MKLVRAALALAFASTAFAAAGCKGGCTEYADEITSKAKECDVEKYKDSPGDLLCNDSSNRMASCQAKCVKELTCDAFVCFSQDLPDCPEDPGKYAAFQLCVDECETTALCSGSETC